MSSVQILFPLGSDFRLCFLKISFRNSNFHQSMHPLFYSFRQLPISQQDSIYHQCYFSFNKCSFPNWFLVSYLSFLWCWGNSAHVLFTFIVITFSKVSLFLKVWDGNCCFLVLIGGQTYDFLAWMTFPLGIILVIIF